MDVYGNDVYQCNNLLFLEKRKKEKRKPYKVNVCGSYFLTSHNKGFVDSLVSQNIRLQLSHIK